ncbi:hypothetical protein INP77_10285 [Methylophilus sp. 13]|uniref:YozE family protein n=1 Tax=Methylophilus sp. 13 TaxID=2781018 RepID=UPI00188DFCE1|nr:YozE family protein [Methylophilus sp. 13]MBF5039878.1 hypothetical protein [Methylophilus sp. 13]
MAKVSSFYKWLNKQSNRDDIIGDLAKDLERARNIPQESNDIEIWLSHLRCNGACQEAIEAMHEAWAEFEAL